METYNIELINTKFSSTTTHKVDRNYPRTVILKDYFSESQFISFCDKVDNTIQSVVGSQRAKYICFLNIVWGCILPSAKIELNKELSDKIDGQIRQICKDASRESPFVTFYLRQPKVVGTVRNGDNTNRMIVSTTHIEIVVSEENMIRSNPPPPPPIVTAIPFRSTAIVSTRRSEESSSPAARRLVELDAMKHLLSDQEYEQKRHEIISCV